MSVRWKVLYYMCTCRETLRFAFVVSLKSHWDSDEMSGNLATERIVAKQYGSREESAF